MNIAWPLATIRGLPLDRGMQHRIMEARTLEQQRAIEATLAIDGRTFTRLRQTLLRQRYGI